MVDYGLVCNDRGITQYMIFLYFAGALLSALFVSPLADRFGRKSILITCVIGYVVLTLISISSDSYVSLIVVLILSGTFTGSYYNIAITFMIESTSREFRAIFATLVFSSAPVGGFIVAPLFEKFRDWKYVSVILALSALLFSLSILFTKESPRYYIGL